jgi:hypothetical protein
MEALKRSVEEAQAAGKGTAVAAGRTGDKPAKADLKQAPSAKPEKASAKKKKVV